MIIFLFGPDTYRSRKKLGEIIEHYKKSHKSGLNLKYIDLKEENFQDLKDNSRYISMFNEKKLIVLKNAFGNKNFKENFLKNYKDFLKTEDVILFYEEGEISERDSLYKLLKKYSKSQEFRMLEGVNLKNWIKEEVENYGGKIEPKAIEILTIFTGDDSWQIENEIKKLVSYKKNGVIKEEDIGVLVKSNIETDIFKTVDAIASKNKKQAIWLIHRHIEKGDSPSYLLSMINFQFRNLLIVKNLIENRRPYYSILKISGLHPFIVKKSYLQASKFTLLELKKIYQKIFQVDLAIKTGKVGPETALDILLTEI